MNGDGDIHDVDIINENLKNIKLSSNLTQFLDDDYNTAQLDNDASNTSIDEIFSTRYMGSGSDGDTDGKKLGLYLTGDNTGALKSTENIKTDYKSFLNKIVGSENNPLLTNRTLENEIKISIILLDTLLRQGFAE